MSASSTPLTMSQINTEAVWGTILMKITESNTEGEVTVGLSSEQSLYLSQVEVDILAQRCIALDGRLLIVAGIDDFGSIAAFTIVPNNKPTQPIPPAKATGGKHGKTPRPPNSFILYRQYHHATVVGKNPGIHNNKISQIIGRMWQAEPQLIKDEWKFKADLAKMQHETDHPDYQYQPRKPSDKKRRARKSQKKVDPEMRKILDRFNTIPQHPVDPKFTIDVIDDEAVGSFVSDPSGLNYVAAMDKMLFHELPFIPESLHLPIDSGLGIVSMKPTIAQTEEDEFFKTLDGVDGVEEMIEGVEYGLEDLLRKEITKYRERATLDEYDAVHRFQELLSTKPMDA
ncbi:hypothetical protein ANO11243_051680 [Dothideomycetidae sp. 11243]|nr:hypothetical protein ANO11243_051680 [fungal sp. No.11243]